MAGIIESNGRLVQGGARTDSVVVFANETFYGFHMALDSHALEEFYESRTGQVARRLILRRLRLAWPDLSGQRLLGFGYATPYLRPLVGEAARTIAAIPEARGALPWGAAGRSL